MIPESVKETCMNWFYKIASIRELLPRLYLEIALLKSYNFLIKTDDLSKILNRLTNTIRGIGDPLVISQVLIYFILFLNYVRFFDKGERIHSLLFMPCGSNNYY